MLFLLAYLSFCSGYTEIKLLNATQSNAKPTGHYASYAIDGDLDTAAYSLPYNKSGDSSGWLKVHFVRSDVEKVVIEKGASAGKNYVVQVSVLEGAEKKICGSYTGKTKKQNISKLNINTN